MKVKFKFSSFFFFLFSSSQTISKQYNFLSTLNVTENQVTKLCQGLVANSLTLGLKKEENLEQAIGGRMLAKLMKMAMMP